MMPPNINDLVKDVQDVLKHKAPPTASGTSLEARAALGAKVANHFTNTLTPKEGDRTPNRVWFSQLGTSCLRKEWYTYNRPEAAEPLTAYVKYKFLYGNVVEELTLQLCKAAGHSVEREQEKIEVPLLDSPGWTLSGRIDAIIDGHVVDVKSMSTYSFNAQPPQIGTGGGDDLFGYRWQLSGYQAVLGDPGKDPYLLCVDKTLGHIKLSVDRTPSPLSAVMTKAEVIAKTADLKDPPPRRSLMPYGAGGNMALDTYCSYCAYKKTCWPSVRGFLYSKKVIWLAEVAIEPKVPEIVDAPEE